MHYFVRGTALLSAVLSFTAAAQIPSKPAAVNDYHDEALVFERSETTLRMHADGTGERVVHLLLRVQSEGAARQFGVLSFGYASASETPEITLVRVHKHDGTTVDTPAADAIEMPAAVTREAPLYSDMKEKHVPVRSLAAGDTLEYEVHTAITKAEAPGEFWGANHFTAPGTFVVLAEVLTLEIPKDKYVQVWSPNHKPVVTEHDGVRTYVWNVAQLVPMAKPPAEGQDASKATPPKDPDEDADGKKIPSVAWTTFHNWAEVGDWYRSLSLARAQPTDALRARAEEITKDAKTPEDQVRAIYEYVSGKTRYVGIDFGVGRYQPHAAAEVLANQYGDCKDKDTLLEALLRAKGFSTAPALIGSGITPVPEVPSPSVFNHVITTVNLPSGRIWLDSTPEVAPYRLLMAAIRDQLALVVPESAPATLERTPANAPYPLVSHFEADGALDADGKLTSHVTLSYRTDDEVGVRVVARSVAPAEWDQASQYLSSNMGFSGTTSNTKFAHVSDLSLPIEMSYDYSRHPYGDWDNRKIIPPFPLLDLNVLASDGTAPTVDIDLGAPRTLIAVSHIKLPQGYRTDLPDAIHVKTDFATFDETYRFHDGEIVVERSVVVLQKKVLKADWKKYQAFLKDASFDSVPWIQLLRPSTPTGVTVIKTSSDVKADGTTVTKIAPDAKGKGEPDSSSKSVVVKLRDSLPSERTSNDESGAAVAAKPEAAEPGENASTQELFQKASQQMQARDFTGATATLDRLKAKNAQEPYLWGMYGAVASMQGKTEEALTNYKKEVAGHPDDSRGVMVLGYAENQGGDGPGARKTLQGYCERHPENIQVSMFLARLQTAAEDNEGALKTLQTVADKNPDDRGVRLQLSNALYRLHRNDEAAAAAKSVLDGTDDPGMLNDAGYTLAETGLDLDYAEQVSRKSIAKLEEKSAAITTAEVNSNAFAQTNMLLAAWDTLGYILFREEKAVEAKGLISASWRNALLPEVGEHLGEIDEALGKKEEALTAYQLADAAMGSANSLGDLSTTPDVKKRIKDNIARMKNAGVKTPGGGWQVLQESRTYKIPRPDGVSGWGTFRLQISVDGVVGSQQMTGEAKLAGIAKSINAMKFPELLPPESKAHLLRSGVVSCSSGATCELVLVPNSTLRTEQM